MRRSCLGLAACVLVVLGVSQQGRAIDPKFLPPNTEAAITINIKQILESELLKDKKDLVEQFMALAKGKLEESPAKAYLDKAGFDLLRDLHSITISGDGSKNLDSVFIAIEGKFNPEKLIETAKEASKDNGEALKVSKAGNVNVFEISPKGGDEKTIYAGLINDSLLVAAPTRDGLNATIARVNGGKAPGVKSGIKNLLSTTSGKQSLSIVATGAAIAKGLENAPKAPGGDVGAMLQSVDGLAISVTLTKNITFQVGVDAKDEDSAKKMAAGANFGLLGIRGMIAQKAQEDAKLQPVVDIANTLRVTNQGTNVLLRGEISQANLDKLISMIPR